ncbi:MAG: hypothetical protein U9Q97_02880 [Acidobacteriota bacterium]|nr:hypothetical protein [Acidobacteriota bacterium]
MELNKQISKNNYYSFLWHAMFLALAVNFMDVDTIIPAMMVDAGGSALHLGILTSIMLGGGKFAQLFFAPFLNNQLSKKGYLLGGIIFTIHNISINGILLEITNNENRALYTGLSGAGSIIPSIFSFIGGWIITEFGFTLFFVLFILIIFLSFYFIYKIDCKK